MHISAHGVQFIAGFEGFSSTPYWDPYGGVWTRGFGETEGITRDSPAISREQGEGRLRYLVETRYEWAIDELHVPLSQAQFDALCSFAWNLGAGIFTGQLRAALLRRDWRAAANLMLQYDHAGGQVLEGLSRRRREEAALFLSDTKPTQPDAGALNVLAPNERRLANALLLYRQHPSLHRHGIRVTTEGLVRARKEIWLAAEHGRLADGTPVPRGWGIRNRQGRYAELWRLTR